MIIDRDKDKAFPVLCTCLGRVYSTVGTNIMDVYLALE